LPYDITAKGERRNVSVNGGFLVGFAIMTVSLIQHTENKKPKSGSFVA